MMFRLFIENQIQGRLDEFEKPFCNCNYQSPFYYNIISKSAQAWFNIHIVQLYQEKTSQALTSKLTAAANSYQVCKM